MKKILTITLLIFGIILGISGCTSSNLNNENTKQIEEKAKKESEEKAKKEAEEKTKQEEDKKKKEAEEKAKNKFSWSTIISRKPSKNEINNAKTVGVIYVEKKMSATKNFEYYKVPAGNYEIEMIEGNGGSLGVFENPDNMTDTDRLPKTREYPLFSDVKKSSMIIKAGECITFAGPDMKVKISKLN